MNTVNVMNTELDPERYERSVELIVTASVIKELIV